MSDRVIYSPMVGGGYITDETPAFEIDTAVAGTTYMRYENTTSVQFIKKIVVVGTLTSLYKAWATWANRASESTTWVPINE